MLEAGNTEGPFSLALTSLRAFLEGSTWISMVHPPVSWPQLSPVALRVLSQTFVRFKLQYLTALSPWVTSCPV